VHIKIAFRGATVKELRERWQHALRQGNARLVKRISALLHLSDGLAVAEVAERMGAGESTVPRWLRAFILRGCESLRYGSSPGRPCKLTPTQKDRLKELVAAGPLAAGYPSGCWSSCSRIWSIGRSVGATTPIICVPCWLIWASPIRKRASSRTTSTKSAGASGSNRNGRLSCVRRGAGGRCCFAATRPASRSEARSPIRGHPSASSHSSRPAASAKPTRSSA